MSDSESASAGITAKIELIEEAYEFMLAYAAQGFRNESDSSGPSIRDFIARAAAAIADLAGAARPILGASSFVDVLARDAQDATAAIEIVLSRPSISSQLVDNLNGSVHLRALLTDLFLIDESLKSEIE